MLVIRERLYFFMMRCIIISKNEIAIFILIMVPELLYPVMFSEFKKKGVELSKNKTCPFI